MRISELVTHFRLAVGRHRDTARSEIIKELRAAGTSGEQVHAVVVSLISSARPGRLDDAIDILSECGELILEYLNHLHYLDHDYDIDPDCEYVLMRALGQSDLPCRLEIVNAYGKSATEAMVEAFGDIGCAGSLVRLRQIAADNDQSDFIRKLAAETIEEASEARGVVR